MYTFPYLKDSAFLKRFDKLRVKQQYLRIVVLSFDQKPIDCIEGRTTGGSLTFDGSSAMRRTGTIALVTKDKQNDLTKVKNLLSINKKIQVVVGFANTTGEYKQYPILWFPQGIYVITSPNISQGTNGLTINLTIRDKMCLLNGECGGTLPASVTFHQVEDIDQNGQTVIKNPTIFQIIQELVHHFGGEQLGKIIISDLDNRVKKVMKWTGSSPLFLYEQPQQDGSKLFEFSTNYDQLYQRYQQYGGSIKQFDYGADVGYIMTDFTYPGELIGNAGDTVVTILDKIKSTLGNYEYFYDINGNFIFQQIKNYLNKSYASVAIDRLENDDYFTDYANGKSVYTFDNSDIIISYTNAPQYQQIKNDFLVWGSAKTISGGQRAIRYHLAIDDKPKILNTYKVFFFTDQDQILKAKKPVQFPNRSSFPNSGQQGIFYLAADTNIIYKWDYQTHDYIQTDYQLQTIISADYRTELYLNGVQNQTFGTESNYYYTELKNEWTKIYDVQEGHFREEMIKSPQDIDYFLDFIDSPDNEFSISNIGRRISTIVDDTINCVFAPQYPDIVLIERGTPHTEKQRQECIDKNQQYSQVDGTVYSMLINGGTYKSAFDQIKKELYQYTNYNQQVSLTVLPIYYLQPNTRITVQNVESGIHGDYIIKSLTLPLDINGTMTISCNKALERI